jgi:hypothetical protein
MYFAEMIPWTEEWEVLFVKAEVISRRQKPIRES